MLYRLLRSIAGIALRWYYSRIDAKGLERLPAGAPMLLAVNHPNALIDALVVTWVFPRRVVLTAKATLFSNPIRGAFFRAAGVVPLIRMQDVSAAKSAQDARRNERAFDALRSALNTGRAVLIFPEGVTGDHTSLAPLRTGAARLALQARASGVRGLAIVPVGLTFERKDVPRTRVFAQVGEPIDLDSWALRDDAAGIAALTSEIERRLRAVTLNFETADDAARVTGLASLFARIFRGTETVPPVWVPHEPLAGQFTISKRVEDARTALKDASDQLRERVDVLLGNLSRFEETLAGLDLSIEDVEIALDVSSGRRFAVRELPIVLLAGPFAAWGWLNHLLPFNLARAIGRRSMASAADPAMRTIVSGVALVLGFYALQGAVVYWLLGGWVAVLYLLSLPVAADVNFSFRARLSRATGRARAYFLFRRRPQIQAKLADELRWLRAEARALGSILNDADGLRAAGQASRG